MSNPDNIFILMSTYNGETFLKEQLNSLLSQTHTQWTLLIRDDGSTDNTTNILLEYANENHCIKLVTDTLGNLGIIRSYSLLMQEALSRNASYILFSDQDDVWLPSKIQLSIDKLKAIESQNGTIIPALIHSDLQVTDERLNIIHPSYLAYEKLSRNPANPLCTLLLNNYITGCTMGINNALLKLAAPIPDTARMHDWWCGLCAAAMGIIDYIDQPTILYRQHSRNVIGSRPFSHQVFSLKNIFKILSKQRSRLIKCIRQASALQRLPAAKSASIALNEFCRLDSQSITSRYSTARRLQLKPASKARKLAFWSALWTI